MPVKLSEIRQQFPMYDDVPDAQLLGALHKKMYSDIPLAKFLGNIEFDTNKPDPTAGMSGFDKFAAGMGKSMYDTARGVGQWVGAVDRKDVADARALDAPLMKTGAGKAGDFTGNVVQTLPLLAVPGAATMRGASLLGLATGAAQPSTSTEETLKNTALGGAFSAGGLALGRGAAALWQGATGLLRPFTQGGQDQIASEVLRASATDPAKALANLRTKATELVPGSKPTVGQVGGDDGLSQLERTLYNNPESQGPLSQAYKAQQAARQKAIADVAGTSDYRQAIKDGRELFANQDYAAARAAGVDQNMAAAMQPQIDSLLRRPTMKKLAEQAKLDAADKDIMLTDMGSLDGLDWMKKALDNKITAAKNPASATHESLKTLLQMKDDLMLTLEQISPQYKIANDNFAQMSKNVNAMDAANGLQQRLYKNQNWGSNKEMGSAYMSELDKTLESVKKSAGIDMPLDKVMPANDILTLQNIARDLARKEAGQNAGRAVGSPTMQNMLGQNLLQRIAGPTGLPNTFAQSVLAKTMARPYSYVMQTAQPKVAGILSDAMADPAKATALLQRMNQQSRIGMAAQKAEKYLPAPGLLANENGR